MKDLPMFNKLFVVLCSSLVLCSSVAAIAESEQKWYTINTPVTTVNAKPAADCMYECIKKGELRGAQKNITTKQIRVYGTQKQIDAAIDAIKDENLTSPSIKQASARIKYHEKRKAQYFKNPETIRISNQYIKKYKIMLQAARTARKEKVMQTLGTTSTKRSVAHEKAKKLKEEAAAKKKIADAKAKLIEDERLAKIAAKKVIEDERLAKIAADKEKEEKRLAKIAAAKKIEEKQLSSIAAAKKRREEENAAFAARRAKKLADEIKIAQDLAADKARRLREYEKNKAINVGSIALSLQDELNKGPKNPNIIKSITKDGIVRTLHCNPGPCTSGSVKLHENISGLDMGVPVNAFAKQLKVHMADKKPEANINVNEDLELIDPLTAFNDVEIMNESEAESDEPNDINLTRALSIPKGQVEKK